MESQVPYTAGTAIPTVPTASTSFVDVRSTSTNKLLFRYDPERDLVEWRNGKVIELIDLRKYRQP